MATMARDIPVPPAGPSPEENPDAAAQRAADPVEAGQLSPAAAAPAAAGAPPAAGAPSAAAAPSATAAPATAAPPADAAPVVAAEDREPPREPGKPRKLLYVTLPGSWGALIFACLSFTPSLLPRGGLIQGVVCGITAALGYGLGVWAASIWRAFADREPRRPRRW